MFQKISEKYYVLTYLHKIYKIYKGNMKAKKNAASFIYLDDGVRKFVLNTSTLLQGAYFI
jgi:hypothetical protein